MRTMSTTTLARVRHTLFLFFQAVYRHHGDGSSHFVSASAKKRKLPSRLKSWSNLFCWLALYCSTGSRSWHMYAKNYCCCYRYIGWQSRDWCTYMMHSTISGPKKALLNSLHRPPVLTSGMTMLNYFLMQIGRVDLFLHQRTPLIGWNAMLATPDSKQILIDAKGFNHNRKEKARCILHIQPCR